jgi:hypothetical protein
MNGGRPPEILWRHLDRMAFEIAKGVTPREAARKIAATDAARLAVRQWNPREHRYEHEPVQERSLTKRLERQWKEYGGEAQERLRKAAENPYVDIESDLWRRCLSGPPPHQMTAEMLRVILAARDRIADPLLDAIAELVQQEKTRERDKTP